MNLFDITAMPKYTMLMRIDKFLKVARLIKRRTTAQEACEGARVSVNGKIAKSSKEVAIGDIIEIVFGTRTLKVRITEIGETVRKEQASSMYEVVE